MAAEQRLVLEQLFGRDNFHAQSHGHDQYRTSRSQLLTNLYDNRICKSFLVGTCPHDLFIGTKEDMGRCKRLHLEKYKILYDSKKRAYEKHLKEIIADVSKNRDSSEESGNVNSNNIASKQVDSISKKKLSNQQIDALLTEEDRRTKKMISDFEHDYMHDLQYHINLVSYKISAAEENLKHTAEEEKKIDTITRQLDDMDIRIGLLTQEIEQLVARQLVAKAMFESTKLDGLLIQRTAFAKEVREITDNIGQASQQKLEVCSVCGAYLSRLDSDRRLADHFTGKIHLSYVEMRRALLALQSLRKDRVQL